MLASIKPEGIITSPPVGGDFFFFLFQTNCFDFMAYISRQGQAAFFIKRRKKKKSRKKETVHQKSFGTQVPNNRPESAAGCWALGR